MAKNQRFLCRYTNFALLVLTFSASHFAAPGADLREIREAQQKQLELLKTLPLEISYSQVVQTYHPESAIISKLPDGAVVISNHQRKIRLPNGTTENTTAVAVLAQDSKRAFTSYTVDMKLRLKGDKYKLEQAADNGKRKTTWSVDGQESRMLFQSELPGGEQILEGSVTSGTTPSVHRFSPAQAYSLAVDPPSFENVTVDESVDGIALRIPDEDGTYEATLSPEHNYMIVKEIGKSPSRTSILTREGTQAVPGAKNLFLPTTFTEEQLESDGQRKLLIRFENIQYRVSPSAGTDFLTLEFPRGTNMDRSKRRGGSVFPGF
jgi:hypothetical protein